MSDRINVMVDELRQEEERVVVELERAKEQVKSLKKDLEKVRAGLAALGGKGRSKKRRTKDKNAEKAENGEKTEKAEKAAPVRSEAKAQPAKAAPPARPAGQVSMTSQSDKPSQEEIAKLAAEVLRNKGALKEDDLAQEVSSRLAAQGKSTTGLRFELGRALKDKRFASGLTGWKLAEHTVKSTSLELESV